MPYTVGCNPAPLTFTIRPRFDWHFFVGIAWVCFIGYSAFHFDWRKFRSADLFDLFIFAAISSGIVLSLIRRERIEIYPDQMVWRKTYFGITRSNAAPLADILGADWSEGEERDRRAKEPDHVEFYLPDRCVKACYGFTFDEFDEMREHIRTMYPELIRRWARSTVRSKDFTLLNLN